MSATPCLHLNHFEAHTETQTLFNNINISLAGGSLLHIQGPNGSGKSTLLRMIAGLKPHQGTVFWQDSTQKTVNIESELFYFSHQLAIKLGLTVQENIRHLQSLHGGHSENLSSILEILGLHSKRNTLAEALSQGQQQSLALAPLLWGTQKLWLLDEPFVALDSKAKRWLSQLLNRHLAQKGWVILASHEKIEYLEHPIEPLFLGALDA